MSILPAHGTTNTTPRVKLSTKFTDLAKRYHKAKQPTNHRMILLSTRDGATSSERHRALFLVDRTIRGRYCNAMRVRSQPYSAWEVEAGHGGLMK